MFGSIGKCAKCSLGNIFKQYFEIPVIMQMKKKKI